MTNDEMLRVRYYVEGITDIEWRQLTSAVVELSHWQCIPKSSFEYSPMGPIEVASNKLKCWLLNTWIVLQSLEGMTQRSLTPSQLWPQTPRAATTLVDDILVLASILSCQPILAVAVEWEKGGRSGYTTYASGPEHSIFCRLVYRWSEVADSFPPALRLLGDDDWKQSTGFDPAVYWYVQAQRLLWCAPSVTEIAVYWVCLEILGRAFNDSLPQGHKIAGRGAHMERVVRMLDSRGYDVGDTNWLKPAIKDWYDFRNKAFHEGSAPNLSDEASAQRRFQIGGFVSLVFADMLGLISEQRKTRVFCRLASGV